MPMADQSPYLAGRCVVCVGGTPCCHRILTATTEARTCVDAICRQSEPQRAAYDIDAGFLPALAHAVMEAP